MALVQRLVLPNGAAPRVCQARASALLVGLVAMNRAPAHSSLRACVALVVTLLQLVGALHFALVPHGYSAALGGLVHVHAAPRASEPRPAEAAQVHSPGLRTDSFSCLTDRCPVADAPHGSAPPSELLAAGNVAFGEARLLAEPAERSPQTRRVLGCAPKTSPPA